MARLIPNTFTTFELTPQEELQGSILTIGQKQVIHNKLADVANEKLALILDSNNLDRYIQQEASLKGQMDILQYLLDSSETMEEILATNNNPENNLT